MATHFAAGQKLSEGVETMPRGRKPRTVKPPNRVERSENVRKRILTLATDLVDGGYGSVITPPATIKPISEAVHDSKTDGWIAHVEEPLAAYIQRVSVVDNFPKR